MSKKGYEEQSFSTGPEFSQDCQATSLKQRKVLIWGDNALLYGGTQSSKMLGWLNGFTEISQVHEG